MGSDLEWDKNEWLETSWGKIVELKYGKSLKGYKGAEGAFPVYGTNGPVGFCDKPLCAFPSVIVGRKGAYRGIHYSLKPFYVIDTAYYMTPLIDINLKWAYYFLLTKDINGLDSGSAIPSTRREDFYALPAKVPPRKTQDALVQCLDFFNNKIELNRQINQTLEQMAQTLFKSWFVDFDPVFDNLFAKANYQLENLPADFPEELHPKAVIRLAALNACIPTQEHENEKLASIHESDNAPLPHPDFPSEFEFNEQLGWVPLGWECATLASIARYTTSRMDGLDLTIDNYVSTENMLANKGGIKKASSVPTLKTTPSFIPGNILISNIRPYFKKIWLSTSNGGRSNDVLGFMSLVPETEGYLMNLLYQDDFFDYMLRTSKGSKMPRGDKKAIMEWSIVVPPVEIRSSYSKIVKEFYEVITIRTEENISLAKLRDTLLPKLISGELQIPDVKTES